MTITYTSGTHTVDAASDDIVITGGTLDVEAGAVIVGAGAETRPRDTVPGAAAARPAIYASGAGTTVTVTGGVLTGGNWSGPYGIGAITPGVWDPQGSCVGEAGVRLDGGASLVVTGGTITGGTGQSCAAIRANDAHVSISGGSIVVGTTARDNMGRAVVVWGSGVTVAISGGTIGAGEAGSILLVLRDGSTATLTGGSIASTISLSLMLAADEASAGTLRITGTVLDYTGGRLTGFLSDSSRIDVDLLMTHGRLASASPTEIVFSARWLGDPF